MSLAFARRPLTIKAARFRQFSKKPPRKTNRFFCLPAIISSPTSCCLPAHGLMGVPGASRLIYSGAGHFLIGENGTHIELTGLVIDGANRGFTPMRKQLCGISNTDHVVIDNCQVLGSIEKGIQIDRSKGRIERSAISGAGGDCGIYAFENKGLSIINNEVSDCVNGGILVHRWEMARDGTIVTGNRISQIGAANGGTGQWGNGINVFRAANVMVANNQISDCAFTAIRSNAGNDVQITGNTCLRSGETAIYSEFEFNGALSPPTLLTAESRAFRSPISCRVDGWQLFPAISFAISIRRRLIG